MKSTIPALLLACAAAHAADMLTTPYVFSAEDAIAMTRRLSREFGLLVGTSSGANIIAALRTAIEMGPAARVVTILCDRAERYYSTKLFAH